MARFNTDVIFIDTSGEVRAVHGDLTLRANEAGGGHVIVGSGISLRPEVDCRASDAIDLGQEELRWKTLYACSGNFLDRPTVNGSGVLLQGEASAGSAGVDSIEGLTGVVDLDSPDESVNINVNGQTIELTAPGASGLCTTLVFVPSDGTDFTLTHALGTEDFTWDLWRTDVDPIQAVIPTNISPSGIDDIHIQLAGAASGKIVITACGGSGLGVSTLNALQGNVTLSSTNNGLSIAEVGQDIQLTPLFTAASGALIDTGILRSTLTFTPMSGTDFTLPHLLGIEDFTWNLWRTDVSPIQAVIPTNISPIGLNDVRIQLATAASGKLVIRG